MAKRAIIGFKGVALALIETNTVTAYKSGAVSIDLPWAGSMSRTIKETSQDFYYDDSLYASVKDNKGDDVEIRFAEVPLQTCAELGLGTYDENTGTLEADFNVTGKEYALRCVCNTASNLPMYFNYRAFNLASITFDSFNTRGDSLAICEVIMKGSFTRPLMSSVKPYAIRQPKDDGSDVTACEAWLRASESFPA